MEHHELYGYWDTRPRTRAMEAVANFYRIDIITVDKRGWYSLTRCRRNDDGCWMPYRDMQVMDDPRWYESLRS